LHLKIKDFIMNVNDAAKKVDLGIDKALTERNAKAKTAEAKAQPSAKQGDNVTLSPISVQLQSIQSDVSTSEAFDAQKVEAIKSAISSGEFKVNSEKVADGLLNTVQDLFKAH
jgi:negative regulator of flagellin synthesis FlgM